MIAAVIFSSCGTYTGTGAYTGMTVGSMIGSVLGGITGGPRGADLGQLAGMAGGAAVGAAVGASADKKLNARYQESRQSSQRRYQQNDYDNYDNSGYTPDGNYDDRIDFNPATSSSLVGAGTVEIRNLKYVDQNNDGRLNANEQSRIIFEIYNHSSQTIYNVQPTVKEVTGNKHVYVSPDARIESIQPGKGVRYTAVVQSDKRLKDGAVTFNVSVSQGQKQNVLAAKELQVSTKK